MVASEKPSILTALLGVLEGSVIGPLQPAKCCSKLEEESHFVNNYNICRLWIRYVYTDEDPL